MRSVFGRRRPSVLDRQPRARERAAGAARATGGVPARHVAPRPSAGGWRDVPAAQRRRRARTIRRATAVLLVPLLSAAGIAGARAAGWIAPLSARLHRDFWALRSISVTGAGHLSPAEIVAATGLEEGISLLDVSPDLVAARLRAHPWIRDARVMRLPPGRLLVSVVLREPVARLAVEPPALVDADGRAFALAAAGRYAELPEIVPPDAPHLGERSPALARGSAAAAALARSAFARQPATLFVAADGDPTGVSVRLQALSARVVLGGGDLDAKLARLWDLLATGPAPAQAAGEIDLRFADRAVLRGLPLPDGTADGAEAPLGTPPPNDRAG